MPFRGGGVHAIALGRFWPVVILSAQRPLATLVSTSGCIEFVRHIQIHEIVTDIVRKDYVIDIDRNPKTFVLICAPNQKRCLAANVLKRDCVFESVTEIIADLFVVGSLHQTDGCYQKRTCEK